MKEKGGVNATLGGQGLRPSARYTKHKATIITALHAMVSDCEKDQWNTLVGRATIVINHAVELLLIGDEA